MGSVDCIFADESAEGGALAFNSIVAGLLKTEKLVLARFVAKTGDIPKLVALYPR